MDKVRAFLRVTWQQRFWVLSVVGVLAAVICWMMGSSKLQAEFAADKTAIEGQFSAMDTISKKDVHGNDAVNAKEREEAKKIAGNVRSLWQKLYDKQRKEVLFWPEVLGADFVAEIEKLKFGQNIKQGMRERYLNYIKNRFDALVEMVRAQKMADPYAGGAGRFEAKLKGEAGAAPVEEKYLVQWLDQSLLREKLTFPAQPSSGMIWVRQEDLWVYETLLNVINNTNKARGATRIDNTAIRVINNLEVGQEAAVANAVEPTILLPAGGAVDPSLAGGEMAPPADLGATATEMPMGAPGEGADPAAMDAMLLAGRYVDAEGKPIADGTTGLAVEYRRLPVRMVLMMDQKWLPQVLIECANATLPIEVQRVRIDAEKSGMDKTGAAFEMSAGMGMGMGMGRGGYGGEGGGYMGRPSGGEYGRGGEGGGSPYGRPGMGMGMGMYGRGETMSVPTEVPTAGLSTIEIQGLVYIYNAPDTSALTVPGAEQDLAAADAAVVR
jgi:hypothetical protein